MSDEEILAELRTIRTLLALDKKEELSELLNNLDEVEKAVIEELDDDWSTLSRSDIAEECGVGTSTVGRRISSLEEANLIEKRGSAIRSIGELGC